MTPKQFAALAAAAAVSLTVAILVYAARAPWSTGPVAAGRLAPGLAADAAKVERIVVTQGGRTLRIEKGGDKWQVASQDGYPATVDKVRALLTALADAELLEPKTRVPDRFALLEVDDPARPTSSARLIRLEDKDGAVLAEVIAGKERPGHAGAEGTGGGGGTYVRRPGEEQSWLASTRIEGGAALKDWAAPRVFETQTEKVSRATVEVQGEPPYVVKRGADNAHVLESIPEGKKVKYVNVVDNIVEAATFLDFESVRKATGATGGEAGKVTLEIDGGLEVTMSVRRDKDKTWARLEASGEGEAKKAADEITARTKDWEFEILPSKADTMLKKQADLLEDAAS